MKSHEFRMGITDSVSLAEAVGREAVEKLQQYSEWIHRSVELTGDEHLWLRPRNEMNSIGNLLAHLEGNLRQWILHGLAGEQDNRKRDGEFTADGKWSSQELLERWNTTLKQAIEVILRPRDESDWLAQLTIQKFETTTLGAVVHVVEHVSYHTGQISLLAKISSGVDLGYYRL